MWGVGRGVCAVAQQGASSPWPNPPHARRLSYTCRYQGGSVAGRCLQLLLTDGHTQVKALEYSPLRSLAWDQPAGAKLLLQDVPLRRGLLLLQPENCALLGGQVDALEAARQRAVAAWNAPVGECMHLSLPGRAGCGVVRARYGMSILYTLCSRTT